MKRNKRLPRSLRLNKLLGVIRPQTSGNLQARNNKINNKINHRKGIRGKERDKGIRGVAVTSSSSALQ
jgi:hypothetical protein